LNEIGITADDLYHQIIGAVERGSGKASLNWDDFTFTVNSDYDEVNDTSSLSLIKKGMAPLDAIVWFSGRGRPADQGIDVRDEQDNKRFVASEVYSGFFAWYFSLYTQGRAVAQGNPNFLTAVLAMGADWADSIRELTSADIDKFPDTWVKNVDLSDLGQKSRNRLALGAAGHRYVACLKYIRPQDFNPGSAQGAAFIAGVRVWTGDRVWWDLHPMTKSGDIITVTGSLNKLIEDCLSTCVTPERLQALAQSRILHHVPEPQPTHSNWATFNLDLLPELTMPIL